MIVRCVAFAYIGTLVGLPLLALVATAFTGGPHALWAAIAAPEAVDALWLTLRLAVLVAIADAVLGSVTAWILVRYRFPGRTLLSSLVDLPMAVPTLVAGVALVVLLGPDAAIGRWLTARGTPLLFTTGAIVLALLFVTLPFVTRTVEPVLAALDPAEEEAARTLGAGDGIVFGRVLLPALWPAIVSGGAQACARALAEFGSVIVVSGNIAYRTQTAPVLVYANVEGGAPAAAAAVSLVLLAASVLLTLVTRGVRARIAE